MFKYVYHNERLRKPDEPRFIDDLTYQKMDFLQKWNYFEIEEGGTVITFDSNDSFLGAIFRAHQEERQEEDLLNYCNWD